MSTSETSSSLNLKYAAGIICLCVPSDTSDSQLSIQKIVKAKGGWEKTILFCINLPQRQLIHVLGVQWISTCAPTWTNMNQSSLSGWRPGNKTQLLHITPLTHLSSEGSERSAQS